MAKLSSKSRRNLPTKDFAGPDRSFPIFDENHARNALSRVANKPEAEKERVRAAVHRKFPSIGEGGKPSKRTPRRRTRSRA
jgi:hypothetical protein